MVDFSKDPTARGFFAPDRFEARVYDCEVTGEIPKDLNGAFVRVATEWFYPARYAHDSIFNADGLVGQFRFRNGIVDFAERWVHTTRWRNDQAAHRQLYGLYRNPFTDDPSIREETIEKPYLRTLANTNVLTHGGKLFAMKEDGPPYELDPQTLDTRGPMTFGGKYASQTFSAHPKIDPVSGEMICYGYEATGLASNAIFLYTVDRAGQVTSEVRLTAPYVSMIHDIAITQKHIVIPVFGYETSLARLKAGKIHWAWNAKLPTYIGILPRGGSARDLRWFKGPLREMVHTFNARTEGNKVILEAPVGESNPFPFFPADPGNEDPPNAQRGWRVRRLVFDLGSKDDGYSEEILYSQPIGAFGRIDDRYISLDNRYVFTQFTDPARPFDEARAGNLKGRVTNCYARFDLHGHAMSSYFAGDTHSLGEPVFVPRTIHGAEGDGYLIGIANNLAEMRSELIIADAMKLEAGDIARVILPFRLGSQVHGNWLAGDPLSFPAGQSA
ncbi:MAG TPA: carotenoid oxygenase family protein [Steroidobacteraceae bacterium]|nr:carotenoid oxygenase family protein [Steroidobacteraceae bacterium]